MMNKISKVYNKATAFLKRHFEATEPPQEVESELTKQARELREKSYAILAEDRRLYPSADDHQQPIVKDPENKL